MNAAFDVRTLGTVSDKFSDDDEICPFCCVDNKEAEKSGTKLEVIKLHGCGHELIVGCLQKWCDTKKTCPTCQRHLGKIIGTGPQEKATMSWSKSTDTVPGFQRVTECIAADFNFQASRDKDGKRYDSRYEQGLLPYNEMGVTILELWKIAFQRRVMFTLANRGAGGGYAPVFVIHMKTRLHGGQPGHGYPDDTVFKRNYEELEKNGVTFADLDAKWPWFKNTEFGKKCLAGEFVQEMPAGSAAGAGGGGGGGLFGASGGGGGIFGGGNANKRQKRK